MAGGCHKPAKKGDTMKKRYYMAYGSNLNKAQMAYRCPDAEFCGVTVLRGWDLVFRGGVLTIEKSTDGKVPIGVWAVSDRDEMNLDVYEGFPRLYYKQYMPLEMTIGCRKAIVDAFIYIMNPIRAYAKPGHSYMQTCLDGYDDCGFDKDILWEAVARTGEVANVG